MSRLILALFLLTTVGVCDAQTLERLAAEQQQLQGVPTVAPPAATPAVVSTSSPTLKRIVLDKNKIVFDDGDTIEYPFDASHGILDKSSQPYKGELRLLAFDTPETAHPEHGIFYDQPGGKEATALAKKLITDGKVIEVVTFGKFDYYGRVLAHLIIDGELLAVSQIKAGLAYEGYIKYPEDHKAFPELTAQIADAWENHSPVRRAIAEGREPPISEPYLWRRKNQIRDGGIPLDQWNALTPERRAEIVEEARAKAAAKDAKK